MGKHLVANVEFNVKQILKSHFALKQFGVKYTALMISKDRNNDVEGKCFKLLKNNFADMIQSDFLNCGAKFYSH